MRAEARSPLRHQAEWVILATTFVTNLGVQYISPLLPALRGDLHLDTVQVGWLVGGYSLPSLLVTLPLGLVADLWGSKRVLIFCLLLFGVSGLGTVTAADFNQLLFWRVLQGIAFAPFATLTISMTAESLPREALAKAQSYRVVVANGAEFVLPVLAGWILVLTGGWKPAFYLFAIPLGLALWAVFALPPSPRRPRTERRGMGAQALAEMRRGPVLGITMGGFARWFVKYGIFAYLPLYLASVVHARPEQIGYVIGIPGLVGSITAWQAGRLGLERAGRLGLVVALFVFGVSIPAFTLVPNVWWAAAVAVVEGAADGVLGPQLNSFLSVLPAPGIRVTVVSISGLLRNLGKAIAPGLVGPLVLATGYPAAFAAVGLLGVAAPLYLLPLIREGTRTADSRESCDRSTENPAVSRESRGTEEG